MYLDENNKSTVGGEWLWDQRPKNKIQNQTAHS